MANKLTWNRLYYTNPILIQQHNNSVRLHIHRISPIIIVNIHANNKKRVNDLMLLKADKTDRSPIMERNLKPIVMVMSR